MFYFNPTIELNKLILIYAADEPVGNIRVKKFGHGW
jgi:hypothetical protein